MSANPEFLNKPDAAKVRSMSQNARNQKGSGLQLNGDYMTESLAQSAVYPTPTQTPTLTSSTRVSYSQYIPSREVYSEARVYRNVNTRRPSEYYDWENSTNVWGTADHYEVGEELGRGKFSVVYRAQHTKTNETFVVKVFKKDKTKKLKREILVLKHLQNGPHIVKMYETIKDAERIPGIVFEYVENCNWREMFKTIKLIDLQHYIYQLLRSLDYAHSKGIMHRDVKPQNFMIDPKRRKAVLIDWGLAEFYHPGVEYNLRVATRYYKPPELLIGIRQYDYSLDMWSLGVMLAGILFRCDFFFKGEDDIDQIFKIANCLGTDNLLRYAKRYGCRLSKELRHHLSAFPREQRPWAYYITPQNAHLATPSAVDLLDKLLVYDHQLRFTAEEAMEHPFFDPVSHFYNTPSASSSSCSDA